MSQLISDTGSFWDPDGSRYSEWSYKYCYDEFGNVIKDEYDDGNDGTIDLEKPVVMDEVKTYEYSSKYDSSKGLGTEKSREYCYLK